jgi:colicin import membrane protein
MTKTLCSLLLAALLAACASAPPPIEPQAPASTSVADADRKLAEAARTRTAAEAAFVASEQACYARFFVNNCLDAAREQRRATLARVKAIEVEAERYKREVAAAEHDRELAESERKFREEEARVAAEAAKPAKTTSELPPSRAANTIDRAAAHAQRMKQLEARERAEAGKRAANFSAYEQRKKESEARQREIAEKKAKAKAEAEASEKK